MWCAVTRDTNVELELTDSRVQLSLNTQSTSQWDGFKHLALQDVSSRP